ncbi:MAG: hypothetical protein ABI140_00030 [Jatrophihabitantaceae bacterium]
MSTDPAAGGLPSWVQLLTLMVHGPSIAAEPTVQGLIRSVDGADPSRQHFGWTSFGGQPPPVVAGLRSTEAESPAGLEQPPPLRVWRDGNRLRIEERDGTVNLIVGDQLCWQFDSEHAEPTVSPAAALHHFGSGTDLLTRRDANSFAGQDFTHPDGPIGATTFLGRQAWTVSLAPPPDKPHPIQLVIDAETGLVLQQRNDGFGSVAEWIEFVTGQPLDPALFEWTGQVRIPEELNSDAQAEFEAEQAVRDSWFEANVAGLPLRAELALTVHVHEYDEQTGSFQASLGESHVGMLARRPISEAGWELGWGEVGHRWADQRWDWALTLYHDGLTERGLANLREQLSRL